MAEGRSGRQDQIRVEGDGFGAGDLLVVASTVSAISIALATLVAGEGSDLGGLRPLPLAFLLSGLLALAGALSAMGEVWREGNRSGRDWFGLGPSRPNQPQGWASLALICTTWGVWLLGLAYVLLIVGSVA